MKKIVALLVLVLMVSIMTAGCGGGDVKTYSDVGDTIEVKANGEFIIALDSNPTTGYSWKAVYEESQFELISDNYEQDETEGMVVGAGGTQYLRFKALKTGDFEITLDYKRAWEGEPVERMVFSVEVK
ncbi:MAG: protease inhibitor I42 family protein [Dehalococcoidales bacterium]|nr:protease inhibitor I42 family protein [Dehalococcoidales bacterium]